MQQVACRSGLTWRGSLCCVVGSLGTGFVAKTNPQTSRAWYWAPFIAEVVFGFLTYYLYLNGTSDLRTCTEIAMQAVHES